jgi:membrane protein YdbS with pleckstrin-like domain
MIFENLKIDIDQIPVLEREDFESLREDYLYMRISSRILFLLFAAGIGALFSLFAKLYFGYWLFPILGAVLLVIIYEPLAFKVKGYLLREHDISYKTGLLFFRQTTVPFNRIQHCEYNQGLLGRLFDIASVKVFTAGGNTSDLSVRGLSKESAIKLRDHITKLSSAHE